MNCDACREHRQGPDQVPYIVHESVMARLERTIKRLWVTIILVIVLFVATNGAWLWYENQFEDEVTTTIEANAEDGGDALANNNGAIIYG